MNHADVKNQMADYLEGEISLDSRALVDAHLDSCSECAREVHEMQQMIRLLRTLPDPEQPPMMAANVMRRIRAGEADPGFLARVGRTLGAILEPAFVLPASAIAAAALVVVVVQGSNDLSLGAVDFAGLTDWVAGRSADGAEDEATREARRMAGLAQTAAAVPLTMMSSRLEALRAGRGGALARRDADSIERTVAEPVASRRSNGGATALPRSYGAPSAQEFLASVQRARRDNTTLTRVRAEPRTRIDFEARIRQPMQTNPTLLNDFNSRFGTRAHAIPVSGARSSGFVTGPISRESSGGEDPRDLWLARGLEDPLGFAHFIADQNLAEQELWVSRLSDRARMHGLLEDLVEALRNTGDEVAGWVADDFAAAKD